MELTWIDGLVFVAFLGIVMGVSLYAGRKEQTSEDYFLAGRKLTWWLIGFSLIASNISTEHFVGMAGSAFGRVGLAIASYEWMAAVTLVIVCWWLLPKWLSTGIYTMPEFLEYRYDTATRAIMSAYLMAAYIIVLLATVLFSGALALNAIFDIPALFEIRFGMERDAAEFWANVAGIWVIGIIAGSYTIYGGLKAVVWSDLLQGGALIIGGAIVTILALRLAGDGSITAGWTSMVEQHGAKLHTVLPWNDPDVPWVAVFIGGLWIPNLFYWGLNQFITQRTLAAKSLAEGQKGILFAAAIKIIIPFIIVIPGILAFQLFGGEIENPDKAYPYMMGKILPPQLRGIMFAALCGAVMSTFNSGLNSASTIFTVDLYARYARRNASPREQVVVGRWATAVIVVIACLWAPVISGFEGVFAYIQEIWGFISPGIVAAFVIGLLVPKTPAIAARTALLLGVPLYGFCRFSALIFPTAYVEKLKALPTWTDASLADRMAYALVQFNEWAFLHHMLLVFLVLVGIMAAITARKPLATPAVLPVSKVDVHPFRWRYPMGIGVVAVVAALYVVFW